MDERINQIAALANASAYDTDAAREYVDGAPHLKHVALKALYGSLVVRVFDCARRHTSVPKVLDLGAGEGSVTLPFLQLGAEVVAVDISASQLDALKRRCSHFGGRLQVRCENFSDTLRSTSLKYDIVVVNSALHHVPDYLGMIREAAALLAPHGQFFFFQDPLRYDTVGKFQRLFSQLAYLSWRVFKGDMIGAVQRQLRRNRGIYLEDSVRDNAEYHVTRNGVDQNAIGRLLEEQDMNCEIVTYFSTQGRFAQALGTALGIKNTFAVVAQKRQ